MQKVTEIRKPSEMDSVEKTHRKEYLEIKFWRTPAVAASALLESEIKRAGLADDAEWCERVKQLKLLEKRATTLQQEYDIKSAQQLIPLGRGFKQQRAEMMRQHEQEVAKILARPGPIPTILLQNTEERHEHELQELAQTQKKQKQEFLKHLKFDLSRCQGEIYRMFIQYINQMYK